MGFIAMKTYSVTSIPHPIKADSFRFDLPCDCTIEDAIVASAERGDVDLWMMADCVAIVDDRIIPKAEWASTYPAESSMVIVRAMPGKGLGSLLTAIAVFAVPILFPGLGTLAVLALRIGITVTSMLVQQALAPAPSQKGVSRGDEESTHSISGVRNEARPYGAIPKIFGKIVNYHPPLAAQPYTEVSSDNEQYLRMVFCIGEGPLTLSNFKIGDTPLEQFKGVNYEVREGVAGDTALTLFPAQVREEALSIELKYTTGYSVRRTSVDTDQVSIDISFPNGLQEIQNDSDKLAVTVQFVVQYRLVGTAPWIGATFLGAVSGAGTILQTLISQHVTTITGDGSGIYTVSANSKPALRRSLTIVLPARGQYDIQIKRNTIDDQSDTEGSHQSVTVESSYWTAIRSIRTGDPIEAENVALVAMRVQATDQLSGVIDQFNCTVEARLPVWNGSSWATGITRSPAWAYCDVLRGSANSRPLADSRIDLATMLAWANTSAANGITFDGVMSDRRSVFDALRDIAGTANASPTINQGLYSVVVDERKTSVVQHFTPRNSRNFSGNKILGHRPHAIKVRFPNEETLHQIDEIYVYEDGYSASTATVFETMDLPYTTNAAAAWKRARRAMFSARLRPEIYQLEVDAEHIVCTRGDLARVSHDVPLWGVSSARVKAVQTSGSDTTGVTIDTEWPMTAGLSYQVRFRLSTGATLLIPVDTVDGANTSVIFTTAVDTASGPAVGDLALFGVVGSESVELIVRSIEPRGELSAVMTFVDHSPEIFNSDTGTIPDHAPRITLVPAVNRAKPPIPQVTSIDSDDYAVIRQGDGSFISRIIVGYTLNQQIRNINAEALQARYRHADTQEDFVWVANIPASVGSISISPVDDEVLYEIEIRSVAQNGATSDWNNFSHRVVGRSAKPPSVERMYRSGNVLSWPYPNPPADFEGFLIRANYGTSQDWGMGRPLHNGLITSGTFDISGLSGTQTILVKAVDASGNESETAASVTIDLGDLYVANVINTQSEAPAFTGTITNGTISGGDLVADLIASPLFWGDDSSLYWGDNVDLYWLVSTYSEMSYTASFTPTSDQLNDAILRISAVVTGTYSIDYRVATSLDFWGVAGDPFWGSDTVAFWDADDIGEFTFWPDQLGPFYTTAGTYEIKLTTAGGAVQGVIDTFDLIMDAPDIEELYEDQVITVAANGVRLTPAAARRAIDIVNLTLQDDGGTAMTLRIIDKNATTGALIKAYTAANAETTATFDARTKAH